MFSSFLQEYKVFNEKSKETTEIIQYHNLLTVVNITKKKIICTAF